LEEILGVLTLSRNQIENELEQLLNIMESLKGFITCRELRHFPVKKFHCVALYPDPERGLLLVSLIFHDSLRGKLTSRILTTKDYRFTLSQIDEGAYGETNDALA
jgi:hypothetical protein